MPSGGKNMQSLPVLASPAERKNPSVGASFQLARPVENVPPPQTAESTSLPTKMPESIGVVFLPSPEAVSPRPPRELPAEVMESAPLLAKEKLKESTPLLATQKLIARSLGSPSGVAARLANGKGNSSGSAKGGILLTGGVMEGEQAGPQLDDNALKPYTTTGVVSLRASKEEIAAQAHLDYVTSGLIILPGAEEPRITPPVSVQERFLKNVIQKACGEKVKNLQVALQPNHGLKICLSAANDTEREEWTRAIITLPDLAPYQLSLSVEVAP
jgi:hypothetical protein